MNANVCAAARLPAWLTEGKERGTIRLASKRHLLEESGGKLLRKIFAVFPLFLLFPVALFGADVVYQYQLDWTAVPVDAIFKKITLKVDVGTCDSCQVTVDGSPVSARYSSATGQCIFTTTGTTAIVTGVNNTAGGTGTAVKATLYDDRKWAYSFTFDDCRSTVPTTAFPIFQTYHYVAGTAVNTVNMLPYTSNWNMSWADMDNLYANGWSLFNHTVDHDVISAADAATELDPVKTQLEARYPGYKVTHVVYPYDDESGFAVVRDRDMNGDGNKDYYSAEGDEGDNYVDVWPIEINPPPSAVGAATTDSQWILHRMQAYGADPTLFNGWLDAAASDTRTRWLIAFTHSIEPGSTAPAAYDTNETTLTAHIQYLYNTYGVGGNNSVWMAPSDQVMHYLLARQFVTITSVSTTPTATPTGTWYSATPTLTNTPTVTPTPILVWRINAGGGAYTDGSGDVWSADSNFSGGTEASVTAAIAGTTDGTLYQSERYGSFTYTFPVPPGSYQVDLKFAEIYTAIHAAGGRVFSVSINGTTVLANFDIFAETGAIDTALDKVFDNVSPVGGQIVIQFIVGTADLPKVSAIQVIPESMAPTPTSTSTQTSTTTNTPSPTVTASFTPVVATATPTQTTTSTETATPTGTALPRPPP